MTKLPYFSIVIPTLNEEQYLPKLLQDLSKQTFKEYEVTVVDGGSNDGTLVQVKRFEKQIKLKIVVNRDKGVAKQRNLGAKYSRGQYLIFFDADVRIPHQFLKVLHTQINKNPGYLYTTRLAINNRSQTQLALVEFTNFVFEIFNTLGKPFAPGFNIIIEATLFDKLKGFDATLKLAEDHDLVQRARKLGVLLKILKTPVLYPSFRRPEKIGYLRFITQYAISGLYTLTGEPIKKELYSYPMGGQVYQDNSKQKTISLKQILSKVSKYIEFPF